MYPPFPARLVIAPQNFQGEIFLQYAANVAHLPLLWWSQVLYYSVSPNNLYLSFSPSCKQRGPPILLLSDVFGTWIQEHHFLGGFAFNLFPLEPKYSQIQHFNCKKWCPQGKPSFDDYIFSNILYSITCYLPFTGFT